MNYEYGKYQLKSPPFIQQNFDTSAHEVDDRMSDVSLRDIYVALRCRWRFIATLCLIVCGAAFLFTTQMPRSYMAESLVLIQSPRGTNALADTSLNASPNAAIVESEIEIIRSPAFAAKIVDIFALDSFYEFQPKPSFLSFSWLSGARPVLSPEELRLRAIEIFQKHLEVKPKGRSFIIAIRFRSESAELAARVVNGIADHYVASQLEQKFEGNLRMMAWLETRLAQLRQEVKGSDDKVEAYRESAGLVEGKSAYVASQQLTDLNTQLSLARAQAASAEARYSQVQTLLKQSGGLNSLPESLSSQVIKQLRQQESAAIQQLSQLSSRYGDGYPDVVNARSYLRNLRGKISEEISKIGKSSLSEVQIANANVVSLEGSIAKLEVGATSVSKAQVRLRELQNEAEASRTLYQTLLMRYKEIVAQKDFQQADSILVSNAFIPKIPYSPDVQLIVVAAFLASLLFGGGIALALERPTKGFRTPSQVENLLGVPVLSLVPRLTQKTGALKRGKILKNMRSGYLESLRTLYNAHLLLGHSEADQLGTLLMTSSQGGEGTTTLALYLARHAAANGRKVAFVDCDLRHESRVLKRSAGDSAGLIGILNGDTDLEGALRQDEQTGLWHLPSGGVATDPPYFLGSSRMQDLLVALDEAFDFVVLNAPPVLQFADACILAAKASKTLYVVQWDRTPRELTLSGLRQIGDAGGELAGIVLSRVDMRRYRMITGSNIDYTTSL